MLYITIRSLVVSNGSLTRLPDENPDYLVQADGFPTQADLAETAEYEPYYGPCDQGVALFQRPPARTAQEKK